MKKLINVRVDEDLLEKFKKICEKKGVKMTEACIDCIKNFVKRNEHLLINTQEEEEYEVLTNLFDKDYKKYKVILTKEDLNKIYKTIKEEMIENREYDFESNFEQYKKTYIISKLIKIKKGENWGAIRNGDGVFELVEDSYIYNRFNAFIFKEGKLIEGDYMSVGHILLQIKEEN